MGIREEKGFEAKREEAKRQFDNARRAAHTRIRETRFLWTKKDTTCKGSKEANELLTLSDIEKELDRLKDTAPIRPHQYVSSERWKELEQLSSKKIGKYKNFCEKHTIDQIKSKLNKLEKDLSNFYNDNPEKDIRKYKKGIGKYKTYLSIKNVLLEKQIISEQIGDIRKRIDKIKNIKDQIENIKNTEQEISQKKLMGILRNFYGSKPLSSDELLIETEELIKYFDAKIARRKSRIEDINLLWLGRNTSVPEQKVHAMFNYEAGEYIWYDNETGKKVILSEKREAKDKAKLKLQDMYNKSEGFLEDANLSCVLHNQKGPALEVIGGVQRALTQEEMEELAASREVIDAILKRKELKLEFVTRLKGDANKAQRFMEELEKDPVKQMDELATELGEKYKNLSGKVQEFREELKGKLQGQIETLDAKIQAGEDYSKQIEQNNTDLKVQLEDGLDSPALGVSTDPADVMSLKQLSNETKKALEEDDITGTELWKMYKELYKQHENISTRSRLRDAVVATQDRLNKARELGYFGNEIEEIAKQIEGFKTYHNNKEVNTEELLENFQKMNKNYREFFKRYLDDIQGTKTAKRFDNWCGQESRQLWNGAQDGLDGDAVTVRNVLDRIKELEHFNEIIFSKEFNKVKKLSERRKCCSETYKEDPRTLQEVPKIKELRKHVIDFIEFDKKEAIERVGSLLPHRYHNAPLPDLSEDDLRVLRVALGMGVLHKSETIKSEYTSEEFYKSKEFEPYATKTTIEYKQGVSFIMKKALPYCSYNLHINTQKEQMHFEGTNRQKGLHLSDLIWGDFQLLSSILSSEEAPSNMSEREWQQAKSAGMADKLKTFVPKWMMYTYINNKETCGTVKLFKRLLGTDTFVSNPDDETYEGYIAMLATHVGYRSIYLLNQYERFKDWEIKRVEVNDQAFNVDIFIDRK